MLCAQPIYKFKESSNNYIIIKTEKTNLLNAEKTRIMDSLTFDQKIAYIKFVRDNPKISDTLLEWHKRTFPYVLIPCKKCLICLYRHCLEWTMRCWLEAERYGNNNMFLTLTYDEDHIPVDGVDKKNLSKFMHDLRQYYQRKKKHIGIRFFGCGEYGRKDNRPHYHVLIFNCPQFGDEKVHSKKQGRKTLYQSKILDRIWGKGACTIGDVTQNSAHYVAMYQLKRYNLELPSYLKPQFINMSRKKGIGFDYLYYNIDQILESDQIILPNGKTTILPFSFNRKLKELIGTDRYENEILFQRVEKTKAFMEEQKAIHGLSEEELRKKRIKTTTNEILKDIRRFEDKG